MSRVGNPRKMRKIELGKKIYFEIIIIIYKYVLKKILWTKKAKITIKNLGKFWKNTGKSQKIYIWKLHKKLRKIWGNKHIEGKVGQFLNLSKQRKWLEKKLKIVRKLELN